VCAGVTLVNVYCPNGKTLMHADYPRKLSWFDDLADYLATAIPTDAPAVLCGDFNVCSTPLDSWSEDLHQGHLFHTEAERGRIERLQGAGWTDVFRDRFPTEQAFSWWDYRGGAFHRGHGLRIDLLFATAPVLGRVESVQIDREFRKKRDGLTPSDHAPVMLELAG
jgi:exodeoxyribonuclease-3